MKSSVKHVEFLDHFRGIAIIAVLLVHTFCLVFGLVDLPFSGWFRNFAVTPVSYPLSYLCFLPCSLGSAGVAIFFVVSGFCIHMSFQKQGQQWGGFFIRRFFRIYPPYLAALIFCVFLTMAYTPGLTFHGQGFWKQLLTHVFLVHNYPHSTYIGINGAFWSLAIEAQLYLLYPVLLVLVAKLGWLRTLIILAGCELSLRGMYGLIDTGGGGTNTILGDISGLFSRSPFYYWFGWSLGAYIADAFLKNQPLPFIKTSLKGWFVLVIISYFVRPLDPFRFLLYAVLTAVVTSKFLSGARPKIKIPPLSLDILRKIGLWSYSIYLLHEPLLEMYYNEITWLVPGKYLSAPVEFLLIVVAWLAVIPLGFLWYNLLELPGIALGKRIIQKMDIRQGASQPEKLDGKGQLGLANEFSTSRVMKSGYCLMIGALLVIVIGNLLIAKKLTPPKPAICNNLAWMLATNPEATIRNGPLAVRLAECACGQMHYSETVMVGTLAAAYAEAGRFDDAISTAQLACTMASVSGQQELWQKNMDLMGLYLNHQPYREAASQDQVLENLELLDLYFKPQPDHETLSNPNGLLPH